MSITRFPALGGGDPDHAVPAGRAVGDTDLASVAALIGEPARARMLLALCAGDELTATMLAGEARLSAPATSAHLAKLLDAGLVTVTRSGRHRWYRVAGRDVVAALEALARVAPTEPVRSLRQDVRARSLHHARVCYHHLAGTLAVRLAEALVHRGAVAASEPDALGDVTWSGGPRAGEVFGAMGVTVGPGEPLYPCLDWSVGRPHLSGAAGSAMLASMLDDDRLERAPGQRAVRVTPRGRSWFLDTLGIDADQHRR